MSSSPKVTLSMLSATERKDFRTAIMSRKVLLLQTLDERFNTSIDTLITNGRQDAGLIHTTEECDQLIESITTQINSRVNPLVNAKRVELELNSEKINDEYDTKEREMKARHKTEYDALRAERDKLLTDIKSQRKQIERQVAEEHAGDLLKKKAEYEEMRGKAVESEIKIKQDADYQWNMLQTNKDRIKQLIEDKAMRAVEELIMINNRDEAIKILHSIPSVEEAMTILNSMNGVKTLLERVGIANNARLLIKSVREPTESRMLTSSTVVNSEVVDAQVVTTSDDPNVEA